MTKLPKLSATKWPKTKTALHQSLRVLQAFQLIDAKPLPNKIEYGLYPDPKGASTGPLSFGGKLKLNYRQLETSYEDRRKQVFSIPISGKSQISLYQEFSKEIKKTNPNLKPPLEKITQKDIFDPDPLEAKKFSKIQQRVCSALADFKTRLLGSQTPLILWPHGFDLSFLWFKSGQDEKKDPHFNFGFSPGSPDYPKPYLYFYVRPTPPNLFKHKLPPSGQWAKSWSYPGGRLPLDHFAHQKNPEKAILKIFLEVFSSFS